MEQTEQSRDDINLGRFLSLVLRHEPSAAGVTPDTNGWVDVRQLLDGVSRTGRRIDMETLERIVLENDKNRYSFNADRSMIRANQWHSIAVDVELKEETPPDFLYHGTASRFLDSIMREGLLPGERQHVHLSAEAATAIDVGRRHGNPVVLTVDASSMARDGHTFWLSENGVWLCSSVPRQYLAL